MTGVLRIAALVLAGGWSAAPVVALGQAEVEIAIEKYSYLPAEVRAKAGTTVKWVNNEKRVSHSILFTGEGGFESERIFPGESWKRTFDKPGTYPYTCGPHPEMKGVVIITD